MNAKIKAELLWLFDSWMKDEDDWEERPSWELTNRKAEDIIRAMLSEPTDEERREMLAYFNLWMDRPSEFDLKVEPRSIADLVPEDGGTRIFSAPEEVKPKLTPEQAANKIVALILTGRML